MATMEHQCKQASGPVPTGEQQAIIDAGTDDDVLVVAGAGSGKTTTMTWRLDRLVADGVPPERILGLTFTKKAAAELLSRVSATIAEGAGDGIQPFMKPDVMTYDAFFQQIVRQYGLLVGFDQQVQPLSDAGARQLAADLVGARMGEIRASGVDFGSFTAIVEGVTALNAAIANAMIGPGCEDVATAVTRIRAWDARFLARLDALLDGEDIPDGEPPLPTNLSMPEPGKKVTKTVQERLDKIDDYIETMPLVLADRLRTTVRRRDVLLDLVEAYAEEKHARHMAEFSDFTIAAYRLVSRFPSIGARYRQRYTHVLLDEYQDTSTTQASLIARLFHGEGADRSAVNAVGDPFQSIYAWRGASPGAFRMFIRDFGMPAHTRPYPISATQRNPRIILQAANDLTLPLRQRDERPTSATLREVDVLPLRAAPGRDGTVREGTLGVLAYRTEAQEIDAVVRFAKRMVREGRARLAHTLARDATPGKDELPPYVAVLFRSKTAMGAYQAALEQAGLSTCAVGVSALLERPEIQDILALLGVVADHADAAGLMRLLATPRYGLGTHDLGQLAALADRLNTEYRYRALVAAGVAPDGADAQAQRAAVRAHAMQVPNAVFTADVLLHDDLDTLLESTAMSGEGRTSVKRAARVLRTVQASAYQPLPQVIRAAVQALGLDVDMMLATALHRPADGTPEPAVVRAPLDALLATVDTYTQEIAVSQTPTLRGYLAWVHAVGQLPEETAPVPGEPVDVMLMTVHQAKGLEWNGVAIPRLRAGTFPSNQGERLKIEAEERDAGTAFGPDGTWRPPRYRTEEANTWLTDPTAVPVPVRVDADILPRFPRKAAPGTDPLDALDTIEDLDQLDDDVFGSSREIQRARESSEEDARHWPLTQREETGRRLHADERRLMYVALTRARHAALLTTSAHNEPTRDPRNPRWPHTKDTPPSNFWTEVEEAMARTTPKAAKPGNLQDAWPAGPDGTPQGPDGQEATPARLSADLPEGYFVGDDAQAFEDEVVGDAWNAPFEDTPDDDGLPWPFDLSADLRGRLDDSARDAMRAVAGPSPAAAADGPMAMRARTLTDPGLTGLRPGADGDRDALRRRLDARARRVEASQRLNVTTVQANANAGTPDDDARLDQVLAILRPIPQMSSPAALAGTRLHAWAERFLTAGEPGSAVTREAMAERVARELASAQDPQERRLATWKQRLIESPWAMRTPVGAEQPVVAMVEGIPNLIQGKLDAVFYGGLDPRDPGPRFTVVDWKTGRRPRTPEETAARLRQLDFYRLLLARRQGVPLERVDAALYYVSEPDPARRQIAAEPKGEAEIIASLRAGIPDLDEDD